jgi:hypothetical protein
MLELQQTQCSKADAICVIWAPAFLRRLVCQAMPPGRAGKKSGVARQATCKGFGSTVQFCHAGNLLSVFQEGIVEGTSTVLLLSSVV